MSRPGYDAWIAEHGISREVWDARPYKRWTKKRTRQAVIREAYEGLAPKQMGTLLAWASQSSGLVIHRHSWQGDLGREDLHYVYPEIRPDKPIRTQPGAPPAKYVFPPGGSFQKAWWHLGDREPLKKLEAYQETLDAYRADLESPGLLPSISSPEERLRTSKLRRVITHDELFRNEDGKVAESLLRKHLEKYHPDGFVEAGDLDGQHYHLRRVKVKQETLAKRLDVHPFIRERIQERKPEWWAFALEGCIKSDAITSYVLRKDLNVGVVSVPSVGQWCATYPTERLADLEDGSELRDFARHHLVGKPVFVIPDADGFSNPDVMSQALLCRTFLRRLDVEAHIAAPPPDRLAEGIKGVDDFLGKGGGRLEDLVVYDPEPRPAEEIRKWLLARRSWRRDALERAVLTLEALSVAAAVHGGAYPGSIRSLSRASGLQNDRLLRALRDDLLPLTAIGPPDLDLSIRRERFLTERGKIVAERLTRGWNADGGVITAISVHPGLTARETTPRPRLRNVVGVS